MISRTKNHREISETDVILFFFYDAKSVARDERENRRTIWRKDELTDTSKSHRNNHLAQHAISIETGEDCSSIEGLTIGRILCNYIVKRGAVSHCLIGCARIAFQITERAR